MGNLIINTNVTLNLRKSLVTCHACHGVGLGRFVQANTTTEAAQDATRSDYALLITQNTSETETTTRLLSRFEASLSYLPTKFDSNAESIVGNNNAEKEVCEPCL